MGGLFSKEEAKPKQDTGTSPEQNPRPFSTTVLKRQKDSCFIVAAIDFGTTYSGYAYSFKHDPGSVYTNYWSGSKVKTPTVVLLKKDKSVHSFGKEAMDTFTQLLHDKKHAGWYYFDKFKMKLFVQKGPLVRNMQLEDFEGKKMPAIEIFAHVIKFMKKHLIDHIQRVNTDQLQQRDANPGQSSNGAIDIRESDIHWVLTVPAIWNDSSKQFMREAAEKAGIAGEFLSLALEPEVASLFCCHTPSSGLKLRPGNKYLVLDLGGGTVDIIAHEVNADKSLTELHLATGGDYGGTAVDNAFLDMLKRIFGAPVFAKFKKDHPEHYYELMQDFEVKKTYFDGKKQITMKFPPSVIEVLEQEDELSVEDILSNSPLKNKLEFKQGKLVLSAELVKEFFDEAVHKVVECTGMLTQKIKGLDHIILVGGFAESPYLQAVAKNNFSNLILEPNTPSAAVLKGAVMYGNERQKIVARVCKYTYGIARMMIFKDHHPQHKRRMIGDTAYCDDLFNKHIEIGQQVTIDEDQEPQDYYPTLSHMKQAVLEVYASTERDPKFVTDQSCTFVGLLRIDIPDYKHDRKWKINVTLKFGGTELLVEVHEVKTGRKIQSAVDFLG